MPEAAIGGPREFGSESCRVPGNAHKARNCTATSCATSGRCQLVTAKAPVSLTSVVEKVNARTAKEFLDIVTNPLAPKTFGGVKDFGGLADGGGYKASMDDPTKVPLWMVPQALLMATGRALRHGAKKYAANNWRRGMKWSEVYSALQRHLGAWNEGEDIDPESRLNHLDHASACLGFLTEYVAHAKLYAKFDDRFKRPSPVELP